MREGSTLLMDEPAIRERLRRLIRDRDLTCEDEGRLWAGKGEAKPCVACLLPIAMTDIEYEVDLEGAGLRLRLHSPCHGLWREVCEELEFRLA